MTLRKYRQKRDFSVTPEPPGAGQSASTGRTFVIQKHDASRLHYDFRLELDGVLKSWAVPKGPSLDPKVKSLAVHVEDHPIEYGSFEGVIPEGQYGGGTVMLWDRGTWEPEGDPRKAYRQGKLKFTLSGEKLHGEWTLVRMSGQAGDDGKNWLLIKHQDKNAKSSERVDVRNKDRSVSTGRTMRQIAKEADRVWSSDGGEQKTSKRVAKKRASNKASAKRRGVKKKLHDEFGIADVPGARRTKHPRTIKAQLATLVGEPPGGDEWLHELKLDGYRILAYVRHGKVKLFTRRNNDWTARFGSIAAAIQNLGLDDAVLDGEVVVLENDGTTNFQALQNAMRTGRDAELVYFVFDLLQFAGFDLTAARVVDRKQLLARVVSPTKNNDGVVRYLDHIQGEGNAVFGHACRYGLEGIVSKRVDAPYEQRRSGSWVKTKCRTSQEFVIGGYSDPGGARKYFGSLLLGRYDDQQRLVYSGRVGTGFTEDTLRTMFAGLKKRETSEPPFYNPPKGAEARDVHWLRPDLIAQVRFAEWTDDGIVRQASFQGLREDKEPRQVTRETPKKISKTSRSKPERRTMSSAARATMKARSKSNDVVAGVRISHPDRVVYPDSGETKLDLAQYYADVADWILPHLKDRPLSLVRCPGGRHQKCFYQKHVTDSVPESVSSIEVEEKNGKALYVGVDNVKALISLVQFGTLEFHPWGSRRDRLNQPDRIIFDLDPAENVPWQRVIDAAHELKAILESFDLTSFLRTSGGKGIHLVVPIQRRAEWPEVKEFARDLAEGMTRRSPNDYIATMSKAKRKSKIFIDYLRNDFGSTAIASYSTRARAGAPVSAPIRWEELTPDLKPYQFRVDNIRQRLARLKKDPWDGFFSIRQRLSKAIFKQAKRL